MFLQLPQSPSNLDAILQLKCKAQSFAYGRRLYHFKCNGRSYWLKTHIQSSQQPLLEHAYQNELNFYQTYSGKLSCLLPAQIETIKVLEQACYPSLLLPHADAFLTDQPQQLSLEQIEQRIISLLEAVQAIHELGYLHADLKREHFVAWQGSVKLIDFEQVQVFDHQQSYLTATPRYMAPELFHHQPKSVQTDLYALGIIIYEWLTQQRLATRSYQDWAYLHCQQLTVELPQYTKGLQKWLNTLLAKQKHQRFKSIGQAKNNFTL